MRVLMMPDYRQANPYQRLLAEALDTEGVDVLFPAGYRRGLPLLRAVKANSADVLHLHWLSPYTRGRNGFTYALYSLKLCFDACLVRCFGVKVVWTIHNRLSHDARFPKQERILRRSLAAIADVKIAHSKQGAQVLSQELAMAPGEVTVIPHGHYRGVYGPRISKALARQQLGLPNQGYVFLNFGMIRPYKGLEDLLRAWTCTPELEAHTLVIAGSPADVSYSERLVQSAAGRRSVRFELRHIADEEIPLYFSATDAVVLPFRQILTSGSLLLAMSYGCPLIAPNFGEIQETLGKAGALLYERNGDQALQRLLERAVSGAIDWDALSASTSERCDSLDWGHIAALTKESYRTALRKEIAR